MPWRVVKSAATGCGRPPEGPFAVRRGPFADHSLVSQLTLVGHFERLDWPRQRLESLNMLARLSAGGREEAGKHLRDRRLGMTPDARCRRELLHVSSVVEISCSPNIVTAYFTSWGLPRCPASQCVCWFYPLINQTWSARKIQRLGNIILASI